MDKKSVKLTAIISFIFIAILGVVRYFADGGTITGAVVGNGTSVAVPMWVVVIILVVVIVALAVLGWSKLKK